MALSGSQLTRPTGFGAVQDYAGFTAKAEYVEEVIIVCDPDSPVWATNVWIENVWAEGVWCGLVGAKESPEIKMVVALKLGKGYRLA